MEKRIPQITLQDGLVIPAIGFGTYKLNGYAGINAMVSAIDTGYRLLDSAFNYENEGAVGESVRRSSVPREQLLITSKLPGRRHSYKEAIVTIQESLLRAGLEYYDLYLIHWPNPNRELYVQAWTALIDAQRWGLIRSIGVCNFLPEHIDRLVAETKVAPSINQVELHPFFSQSEQLAYHKTHNVQTESWSPLGRKSEALFQNEAIKAIGERHQKSLSQIVLRWHVQLGSIPIPKATSQQRQQENLDIFDFVLSSEEMETIAQFSREDGRLANQNPAVYEEF
ncbi:MAG: aldo/keto reductase [Lachnospiraceae bacterium]